MHIVCQLRHGLIDALADSRRNPAADLFGEYLRRRGDAEGRLDRVERAVRDIFRGLNERADCVRDAVGDTLDDIAAEVKPVGICDCVPYLADKVTRGLPQGRKQALDAVDDLRENFRAILEPLRISDLVGDIHDKLVC